jgi:hypothetical protein
VFNYDFVLFSADDAVVIVNGVIKTLTTDYAVTGVGNASGGTIVMTAGVTLGHLVTIYRDTKPKRSSQYQADGTFDAEEKDFMKTKITLPSSHSILLIIAALVAIASWFVPSGKYDMLQYDAQKNKVLYQPCL